MPDDTAPTETQRDALAETAAAQPRRKRRRGLIRWTLLLVGPLAAILGGGYVYMSGGRYVSTENAYVKADKVTLTAQVSGAIADVLVVENQHVDAGDVLFRVDDTGYRALLAKAQADLAEVATSIDATKANYHEMQAELGMAREDVKYADTEFKRQEGLSGTSAASKIKLDATRHDLATARRKVSVMTEQLAAIKATLAGGVDVPLEQQPRYQAAKAVRDHAKLEVERTVVTAPFAGVVRNVPNPGQYVNVGLPGGAAISLIADRNVWIEANFKETDLTYVRPGQPVTIAVDTYPGQEWTGSVASISQATGAEFSILPAQNATGNWVKVVQRIPVRIAVAPRDGAPPLRAGMSTEVEIDTGHRRVLPGAVQTALEKLGVADAVADVLPGQKTQPEKTRP